MARRVRLVALCLAASVLISTWLYGDKAFFGCSRLYVYVTHNVFNAQAPASKPNAKMHANLAPDVSSILNDKEHAGFELSDIAGGYSSMAATSFEEGSVTSLNDTASVSEFDQDLSTADLDLSTVHADVIMPLLLQASLSTNNAAMTTLQTMTTTTQKQSLDSIEPISGILDEKSVNTIRRTSITGSDSSKNLPGQSLQNSAATPRSFMSTKTVSNQDDFSDLVTETTPKPSIVWSSFSPPYMASSATTTTNSVPAGSKRINTDELRMGLTIYSDRLYLLNAYSDFRAPTPTIRIIVYASKDFNEKLYCHLNQQKYPASLQWINFVSADLAIWRAGYLICDVRYLQRDVTHVIVGREVKNVTMPLFHALKPKKKDLLGLCVKCGYGSPSAARFVEWMELNSMLGIGHVILYDQALRGPIRKVMQYYSNNLQLTVVKETFREEIEAVVPIFKALFSDFDATYASGNEPFAQMELLSIQDCFHRFRGRFEYILVADIDEIIIPTAADSLTQLLATLKSKSPEATPFAHQSAAYLMELTDTTLSEAVTANFSTSYMHMLTHTRHRQISWGGSKAIHSTLDTECLNWQRRIWPQGKAAYVDESDAWLHHYRNKCKGDTCDASSVVVDDKLSIMGRYAARLTERVDRVSKFVS